MSLSLVSARSGVWRRLRDGAPLAGLVVTLLLAWQISTILFEIPAYTLPAPTDIVVAIAQDWQSLLASSLVTFGEAATGFLLSVVVGVPLGALIVFSTWLNRLVYPLLVASQSVPKVALAPVFVVWFGFGLLPKVLIAFSIAFFPIVVNTIVGIARTPLEMMHLMRSLGASPIQIFLRVQMPVAAPYVFAGTKVAATFAIVGAIVGEFIAANSGLGYLQLVADNNFQIPLLFGILVILSLMGAVLYYAIVLIERLILPRPLRSDPTHQGQATL